MISEQENILNIKWRRPEMFDKPLTCLKIYLFIILFQI